MATIRQQRRTIIRILLMKHLRLLACVVLFTASKLSAQDVPVLTTIPTHSLGLFSVAFGPDNNVLVSAASEELKIWHVATSQNIATVSGQISYVAISPDGKAAATVNKDGNVKLYAVATGKSTSTFSGPKHVKSVAFSPDGKTLALSSGFLVGDNGLAFEGTISFVDVASGNNKVTHKLRYGVWCLAFSPDGKFVASGGYSGGVKSDCDGSIDLWDATSGRRIEAFKAVGSFGSVQSVAFSPDGAALISGHDGGDALQLWHVPSGRYYRTLAGRGGSVESVTFSSQGNMLAAIGNDKAIKLWDTITWKNVATIKGHGEAVRSVAFSGDGKILASCSLDKTIKLWDVVGISSSIRGKP